MNFRPVFAPLKLLALLTVISLSSCKKDAASGGTNNTSAASLSDSSTAADNMYYDVLNNAFVTYSDNASIWTASAPHRGTVEVNTAQAVNSLNSPCLIYTIDNTQPGSYPKKVTLDFGTGCTGTDGITRQGIITFIFTGPLLYPGSTASASFTNYVVNGYGLQGTYSITNNSSETAGIVIKTQVTNGIITYPNLVNYHYSHNKTYTMTAGMDTPFNILDDVYALTGNSSFSTSDNQSIVFTAASPLVKAVACRNISKGVVNFVYDQSVSGTIDFGDGTCDNQATVAIGTYTKNITLR